VHQPQVVARSTFEVCVAHLDPVMCPRLTLHPGLF
jgi:hypothetical protein